MIRKGRLLGGLGVLLLSGSLVAPAILPAQITVTSTFAPGSSASDLQTPNNTFTVRVSASGFTTEAPTAYDFRINFNAADVKLVSATDLSGWMTDLTVNPPTSSVPDWDSNSLSWFRHVTGADQDASGTPSSPASSYNLVDLTFMTTASPTGPITIEIVANDRSPHPINPPMLLGDEQTPTPVSPTFVNSALAGLSGGTDLDVDGVVNTIEGAFNNPGALTNILLPDSDGDGLTDEEELNWDESAANFKNFAYNVGLDTNPRNRDTDNDGFPDGLEAMFPATFVNGPLVSDSLADADGDRLPDVLDPNDASIDSDNDRVRDGYEALKLGLAAVSNPAVKPPIGDVNNAGGVNVIDANILASLVAGNIPITSAALVNKDAMDVNRDGVVNVVDASIIASFAANNVQTLPINN